MKKENVPSSRSWKCEGQDAEWLRLIDFINPGSEVIKGVIAEAKHKAPNGEFPAYLPAEGWSLQETVDCQVAAIYETLLVRGIGYAVERWDSQPSAQVIRTHEEVLSHEGIGGPCIDLVVLTAACLEAVGLQPLVVVLENAERRHAVLGYRVEELRYGPETPANEIPSLLSESCLDRREVQFVNCTGITRGENTGFVEARDQGRTYVDCWKLIFALDVRVARHTALTREMMEYLEHVRNDILTVPQALGFPSGINLQEMRVQVRVKSRQQGCRQDPWTSLEENEREEKYSLDWDREVSGRLQRAVILGDPGSGKTWLLKYEALRLAEGALGKLDETPLAAGNVQFPVLLHLAQLTEQLDRLGHTTPLEEALLLALERRHPLDRRLKKWIEDNLNSGQCVLLLDALDEVPPRREGDVCRLLDEFARKHDQTRILLTSRLVGYPGRPFPLPQEGEFELLPFHRSQQREFAQRRSGGRPEAGDLLLRKLRESPRLQSLSGNPLLLALLCRLFDESGGLPRSTSEFHAGCIHGILRRQWKIPRSGDHPYLDAKLEFVEELACALFLQEKEPFSLRSLCQAARRVLETQPYLRDQLGKTAAELVGDLMEDGLLIRAGAGADPRYLFLHPTFQEYLTACALARRTDPVQFDGREAPEWLAMVRPHIFDPRWEEVICFLASGLEDATPLILAIWKQPEGILELPRFGGQCTA